MNSIVFQTLFVFKGQGAHHKKIEVRVASLSTTAVSVSTFKDPSYPPPIQPLNSEVWVIRILNYFKLFIFLITLNGPLPEEK